MWKFIGTDRSILLDYEFKHCTAISPRYIEDNSGFGCGGDIFINDNEDYFKVSDFCSPDDSVYVPEHYAKQEDAWLLETLINNGLVIWEDKSNENS